jgi:HEAT repeat protein
VAPLLLLALALLAGHVFVAACLYRLARRAGDARARLAWVPLLNLVLPVRLAGRSDWWGLLLLLPGPNVIVWGLLWAEACRRLGRPAWLALPMCVPVVNLAVLANLAGLSASQAVIALGVLLAACVPAAMAAHVGGAGARARAAAHRLDDPDPAVRRKAVMALARAGSPAVAVPRLAAALQDGDEHVRAEAASGLEATPGSAGAMGALVAAVGDPSALVRGHAARAVCASAGGRVPTDVATLPLLRALLDSAREHGDDEMPDAALVLCLASFGPSATPHLIAAFDDADFRVRWHAAAALMQLRRGAHEAAPALRRAMDDPEWPVRNAAGRALEDVVDRRWVPLLAEALADPSAETRYHIARALARVGPGSAPALPVIEAALRDADWEVRMEAAWALAAIGPAAAATEPALLVALRDPDPQVRASAAWGLAGIGGTQAAAVPALRRALRDSDRQAREAAAGALARLEGRR